MTHLYIPSQLLTAILDASWHASLLALIVLAFQFLTRKKLPARWRFALWFLVLLRLSGLALPESRLSIFNWVPASPVAMTSQTIHLPEAVPVDAPMTVTHPTLTPMLEPRPAPAWWHWVISLYIAGLATIATRLAVSMHKVHAILRRAKPLQHPAIAARLVRAQRTIGITRDIPLLTSEETTTPALIGWLRPRLLVPATLLELLTPAEWEFVFLHECAHLKRNDVLINYWLALLSAVHWFNPIAWILWPRIRADRELACDEHVLLSAGNAPAYGKTLLKLFDGATRLTCPAAVGVIAGEGNKTFFKRRIQMIAAFRRTPTWVSLPATAFLLIIAAATLTSAVSVAAQSAAPGANLGVPMPPPGYPGAAPPSPPLSDEAAHALNTPIKEIRLDGQSLDKALTFLADTTNLNFVINWQALQNAGVDKNTPVTINVKNVPLHKVLDIILAQTNQPLGYDFSDNVLTISTRDTLPKGPGARSDDKIIRVYNVRDLLAKPTVGTPTTQPENPTADATESETQKLRLVILQTIEPATWFDNGGSGGSIQSFHGLLTITATGEVHDKIAELLSNLRNADREQPH
ncbi:MAG TPA: M56 family metallopeptidase [Phycisphaerae bacterium]|nr:M56 family metallopeptidase [Phycisphaerae bacterium]